MLARTLAATRAGTGTAADVALTQVVGALRRRGMVVLISDLLLDRTLTLKALRFLRHRGHQVLVLQLGFVTAQARPAVDALCQEFYVSLNQALEQ